MRCYACKTCVTGFNRRKNSQTSPVLTLTLDAAEDEVESEAAAEDEVELEAADEDEVEIETQHDALSEAGAAPAGPEVTASGEVGRAQLRPNPSAYRSTHGLTLTPTLPPTATLPNSNPNPDP